jgi:16S rRNA (guanine966-N2)-methyltransferase
VSRIVAGVAKGRRLQVPPGRGTRPTSDRAREGLFSAAESMLGGLAGCRVLDLYAGSGAVGLEALSRGAAAALLVDVDRAAVAAIRSNVQTLGLGGAVAVRAEVARLVGAGNADAAYDLAFLDPPYAEPSEAVAAVLVSLLDGGWLRPGGLAVVERATRAGRWPWPPGYAGDRTRPYGEGTLWYGRAAGPVRPGAESSDRE